MRTLSRLSLFLSFSLGVLTAVPACRAPAPVVPGPAPAAVPAPTAVAAPPERPVPATFACPADGAAIPDDVPRSCVPLQGAFRGAPDALVNLVMFSDFECPFCARVLPTLDRLARETPELRFYFRQAPLPFHAQAMPAALASVAAGIRGQFWPMHDKLFADRRALGEATYVRYAGELGIAEATFRADLADPSTKALVDADLALGRALAVRGTPHFFINGRRVAGAQPYEAFKAIIDDELVRARKLLAAGTPRADLYAALMAGKGKGLGTPADAATIAAEVPRVPLSSEVFKVLVGKAPARGATHPKVTLIAFSDFQCPYCAHANETLDKLRTLYPDDLRIAFKHFPLPFHDRAAAAALASLAAGEQGKFWPMHDRLFAERTALAAEDFERHATALGLDLPRFQRDLASPRLQAALDADLAEAARFGVKGTPSFFVNGRMFAGAYPLASFKTVIEEARADVDRRLAAGLPRAGLYDVLIKDGLARAPAPVPAKDAPDPDVVHAVPLADAPVRGAKHALVTIVEFSDFQCPFCKRATETIDRILKEYPGQVRVAWRNLPLPFHDQAKPAALAAMAANQQGKFWDMHQRLFASAPDLSDEALEKHARALKLDMKRWQKDRGDQAVEALVVRDGAAAKQLGIRGTPVFFINGKIVHGAQPYGVFKDKIDAELAAAKAMVKRGVPAAKVYETIMKKAQPAD